MFSWAEITLVPMKKEKGLLWIHADGWEGTNSSVEDLVPASGACYLKSQGVIKLTEFIRRESDS